MNRCAVVLLANYLCDFMHIGFVLCIYCFKEFCDKSTHIVAISSLILDLHALVLALLQIQTQITDINGNPIKPMGPNATPSRFLPSGCSF